MPTECISAQFEFEGFARRRVVAGFDGGAITSDAGALLLRHADRAIDLVRRVAGCFRDGRREDLVVHQTSTLVGQRIVAIALGYEDVDDHDTLRFDPVLGLLSDRLEPKRDDCARLAGKSTLNRLERSAASDLNPRYQPVDKVSPGRGASGLIPCRCGFWGVRRWRWASRVSVKAT